jgi:uncharacterized membrane protein YqaE (UPF0057 family)
MLEILKQPGTMPVGYAEFRTFKKLSPFIFAILFGFAGFSTKDLLMAIGLICTGFFVGSISAHGHTCVFLQPVQKYPH